MSQIVAPLLPNTMEPPRHTYWLRSRTDRPDYTEDPISRPRRAKRTPAAAKRPPTVFVDEAVPPPPSHDISEEEIRQEVARLHARGVCDALLRSTALFRIRRARALVVTKRPPTVFVDEAVPPPSPDISEEEIRQEIARLHAQHPTTLVSDDFLRPIAQQRIRRARALAVAVSERARIKAKLDGLRS